MRPELVEGCTGGATEHACHELRSMPPTSWVSMPSRSSGRCVLP